jgi:hypothetical protein
VLVKAPENSSEDQVGETEEEGIEIVAWGRFQSKEQHGDAIEIETAELSSEEAGSLSVLYRSSDSTFVAFYRP